MCGKEKNQLQTVSVLLQESMPIVTNLCLQYTSQFIDVIFSNRNVLLEKVTLNWEYDKDSSKVDEVWFSGVSFTIYSSEIDFVTSVPAQVINQSAGAFINPNPQFTISSQFPEIELNLICQGASVFNQYAQLDLSSGATFFDLAHIVVFHFRTLD